MNKEYFDFTVYSFTDLIGRELDHLILIEFTKYENQWLFLFLDIPNFKRTFKSFKTISISVRTKSTPLTFL